ncbi:MAG: Holliday junction branch migration protein RuvA, partial [Microcystaceae cyanobacterium]
QVPASMVDQLELASPNMTQIFTYFQVREDHQALYGFLTQAERELFGQLVSVSGIGTQLAIALLETLGLENLVQAVVTGNINQLAKTPGVGKKTAERLALELKSKLSQWRQGVTTLPSSSLISTEVLEIGKNLSHIRRSQLQLIHDRSRDLNFIANVIDFQN